MKYCRRYYFIYSIIYFINNISIDLLQEDQKIGPTYKL